MDDTRIGRLRLLSYNFVVFLIALPVTAWSFVLIVRGHAVEGALIGWASSAVLTPLGVMISIRRLHDLNLSGKWAWFDVVLLVYPKGILHSQLPSFVQGGYVVLLLAFLVYSCVLVFAPGSPGDNRFGAPPPPNTVWVTAGVFAGIIFPIASCTTGVMYAVHHARLQAAAQESSDPAADTAIDDLPALVAPLHSDHPDGSFVAVSFFPDDKPDEYPVNLQWSIKHGEVGLEYMLSTMRELRDQDEIREFARRRGFAFKTDAENGIGYMRCEGEGTTELGIEILKQYYGLRGTTKVSVLTRGLTDRRPSFPE